MATAVQNPLTSLAGDVAHTRRVLAQQPRARDPGGSLLRRNRDHPSRDAGHLPLITHPGEVTQLIMNAVQAVRTPRV